MNTLEERIDDLERQNRRMKLAGVAVVLIAAASLLMGWVSPQSKVLEGEKLLIQDAEGRVGACLEASEQGSSLTLHDKNGGLRIRLAVAGDRPNLSLTDKDGQSRILLDLDENGPGLWLFDENGVQRADFAILKGYPYVGFQDEEGDSCAGLCIFGQGPELWLLNEKDREISARLGVTPEPYLIMKDDWGLRASLHLLGNSPQLVFLERHMRSVNDTSEDKWVRAHLGISEKKALLKFFDEKGKLIFKAPK